MKKLLTVLLIAILAIGSLFVFAACDIDLITSLNTGTTQPGGDPEDDETGDEIHEHSLTHADAVSADCTHAGNMEYWYCSDCDKYYSDANGTDEITLENTVIAKDEEAHTVVNHKCTVCKAIIWSDVAGVGMVVESWLEVASYSDRFGEKEIIEYQKVKLSYEITEVEETSAYNTFRVYMHLKGVSYCDDSGNVVSTATPTVTSDSNFQDGSYAVSQKFSIMENGVSTQKEFLFEIPHDDWHTIYEINNQYTLGSKFVFKAITDLNGTYLGSLNVACTSGTQISF